MSSISFSKQNGASAVTVTGAKDLKVNGYGTLNGTASFGLTETEEGAAYSVFNMGQTNSSAKASIVMDSSDSNYSFTGCNIYAKFDKSNASGYNLELNTCNSSFDLSASYSNAFIVNNGMNTSVALGGNANRAVFGEEVTSADGQSKVDKYYNNMVIDNGYGNYYESSALSVTRFETTENSVGANVMGYANDSYYIGGSYGTFQSYDGYNLFKTGKNSVGNLMIGGVYLNRVEDYGTNNAYINGYDCSSREDYINFFGNNGLAATTTNYGSAMFNYAGGSNNAGFTGPSATVGGRTYNFKDIASEYGWSSLASFYDTVAEDQ